MHCSPQKVFYVTKFLSGKQNSAYLWYIHIYSNIEFHVKINCISTEFDVRFIEVKTYVKCQMTGLALQS